MHQANLSTFKLLKAQGEEATKYLQGQLAIDMINLADNSSSMGFLADHTGKVFSIFRLFKINTQLVYLLVYGQDNFDELFTRLKKFAVFNKVTFSQVEDFYLSTFLVASNNDHKQILLSSEVVQQVQSFLTLQDFKTSLEQGLEYNYNYVDSIEPQALSITPYQENQSLLVTGNNTSLLITLSNKEQHQQALAQTQTDNELLVPCNLDVFLAIASLDNNIYHLSSNIKGQHLAYALGFEHVEAAINYKKGCYQGQEGIARARYRGNYTYGSQTFTYVLNKQELDAFAQEHELILKAMLAENKYKVTGEIANINVLCNKDGNSGILVANSVITKKLPAQNFPYELDIKNTQSQQVSEHMILNPVYLTKRIVKTDS